MDPSEVEIPHLKDLSIENITENVKKINQGCSDPRLKYLMERAVQHLHDFARETRLSHDVSIETLGAACFDCLMHLLMLLLGRRRNG